MCNQSFSQTTNQETKKIPQALSANPDLKVCILEMTDVQVLTEDQCNLQRNIISL